MILAIGSLLGFIAVAFGAYVEHGMRSQISAEIFDKIMVGIRYNQIHAVVIICIGLFLISNTTNKTHKYVNISGWLFIMGTSIFCFSIYLARGFSLEHLVNLAPFGGVTLMIAWLSLAFAGLKSLK